MHADMQCRLSFTLVCLIVIVAGICILALQIVSATITAWVSVSTSQSTFSYGMFSSEASASLVTLKITKNSAVICLQAMFIFSVGSSSVAVITTMIGITQREICGRGTHFYVRTAEVCFVLSAILYLIGIAVFTHFWTNQPQTFFQPEPIGATYNYGYAYMLGWLVFFLQTALAIFIMFGIHVVVRKQDSELLDDDEGVNETKKLIGSPASIKRQAGLSSSADQGAQEPSTSVLEEKENVEELTIAAQEDIVVKEQGQ